MSEHELIEAYVKGRITRRAFVRGLLAAGASLTAALTYADTLAYGFGEAGSGSGTTGGTGGSRRQRYGGSAGSGTSGGVGGS